MSGKFSAFLFVVGFVATLWAAAEGGAKGPRRGPEIIFPPNDVATTQTESSVEGTTTHGEAVPWETDPRVLVHVRKCCPFGHVTIWSLETRSARCLPHPEASRPDYDWTGDFSDFNDDSEMIIAEFRPTVVVEYGVPVCNDLQVLLPNRDEDQEFAMFVSGAFGSLSYGNFPPGSYCMDRLMLASSSEDANTTEPAALICPGMAWRAPTGIESHNYNGSTTFRKCCKRNQVLNPSKLECVDHDGRGWRGFPVTNSMDGGGMNVTSPVIFDDALSRILNKKCSNITLLANRTARTEGKPFYMLETGHLYIPHSLGSNLYNTDRYCLDVEPVLDVNGVATTVLDDVALLCVPTPAAWMEEQEEKASASRIKYAMNHCGSKTCVLKCCAQNFILTETAAGVVQCDNLGDGFATWQPTFHDTKSFEEVELTSADSYTVLDNFTPTCPGLNESDKVLRQVPVLSPEQKTYLLLTDGAVYVKEYEYKVSQPAEYCVDAILLRGRNETVSVALACVPARPGPVPVMFTVYAVCLVVSSVFLFLTFVLTLLLPDMNRLSTWTLLSYVLSLMVGSLLLVFMHFGGGDAIPDAVCVPLACLLYYALLSAFLWLNVMSFDIWCTLRRNLPSSKSRLVPRFVKRCFYAFGVPLLMTTLVLVMQFVPGVPDSFITRPIHVADRCWFSNDHSDYAILFYFYGPVALVLAANLVFFCLTGHILVVHRQKTQNLNLRESNAKRFALFAKLFVVMGIAWIAEVVSWKVGPAQVWYAFDMANALQGIFVFAVFICRGKTLRDLRVVLSSHPVLRHVCCCCCWAQQPADFPSSDSAASVAAAGDGARMTSTNETSDTSGAESSGKNGIRRATVGSRVAPAPAPAAAAPAAGELGVRFHGFLALLRHRLLSINRNQQ